MKGLKLEGQRFGRLLAIGEVAPIFSGGQFKRKRCYLCKCDCGNETVIRLENLRSGHTQSCGCYMVDQIKKANTTHGHHRARRFTRTYAAWVDMLTRCTNPARNAYIDYGGRGITVCNRWAESFENFLADMGECPKGKTLERVDVNGDYDYRNCIWADRETQANNTRRNVLIWTGENYTTMARFAKAFGIPYHRFRHQYRKKGIPIEQILLEGNYLE